MKVGGADASGSVVDCQAVDLSGDGEEDEGFHRLSPQAVPCERRTGYVVSLIVVLVVVVSTSAAVFLSPGWWKLLVVLGWLVLVSILVYFSHFWPPIKYRHTRWRLTDVGMEIQRGVFWKHRIAIPIARVQHIDVSQGPVQRLFQLGKLTIHTAGTKNAFIELDGLEHGEALKLRDQLITQKETLDVI